ncbi:hypothetical protein CONPUDRAFT_145295 [Coniophora puteana RWD-64-598 SS2]|uniref:Uncharacterized protein n=1 Tax=Coniophora puteana (strain RWD-64-598) TaxID=741705 RepID=A0A5M3MIV2_CONPW|nr:uncharacterized protein CONPUDRAFT_145295 [Coniophora puteana RWD-64-598 SS2]EIW79178.1 hypothetical protein CONPUDRAFT_145295 [Coniophora puteana RWD-64-598 SS2]
MSKNRTFGYQNQPAPAMSPTPFFTAGGAVNPLSPDDEDDNDICPVCDGDCTCDNRPRVVTVPIASTSTHAPSTNAHSVATPVASTSSSSHAPAVQSLKIKLTVPTSMQNRVRAQAAHHKKSRGGVDRAFTSNAGEKSSSSRIPHLGTSVHGQATSSDLTKRKGRKLATTSQDRSRLSAQERLTGASEQSTLPHFHYQSQSHHHRGQQSYGASSRNAAGKQKIPSSASRPPAKSAKQKGKSTAVKKGSSSKKKSAARDASDSDFAFEDESLLDDDDDNGSFPTFLSASALSSGASSDSSSESVSESTGFDSDSSLEAEEETYILSEQRRQEKARVRRELLGDETYRHKDIHNNWVIRPRKKSVGLSDVEMDSDNDDTSNGEEEEEEGEDEMEAEDDDETDDQLPSRRFKGLVTGWSESEESTFDADIFFANLSSSDSESVDDENPEQYVRNAEQESAIATPVTPRTMDFEVTEGWDGQIVFTNGLTSNQVVDMDFEAHTVQLTSEDGTSVTQSSDVEMRNSEGDEGGYEEEDEEFDDGESGDTTEEELVDERGLPTSRAMRMFRWPASVSAINPLSTVSPTVSPAPNNRRTTSASLRPMGSPRPADILAGRVFFDESDEHPDSGEGSSGGRVRVVSRAGEPLMGQFDVEPETPQKAAIITGANKDVPSPFPRLGHRRRFSSSAGSFSSMDFRGRSLSRFDVFTSGPVTLASSEDPFSETSSEMPLGEEIDLDDVLDPSYLNDTSASEYPAMSSTASEGESNPQNFYRWDRVPVGAFRLTREGAGDVTSSPGWTSEPPTSTIDDHVLSYSNMMKSSPLSTLLWHDRRPDVNETPTKSRGGVTVSPVVIPSRDGDQTPVPAPQPAASSFNHQHSQKTRKESRREMKRVKRKLYGPVHSHYSHHQQHQFRQHHHYHHHHHPNAKPRGAAGVQRMKFSSPSTIPSLNI